MKRPGVLIFSIAISQLAGVIGSLTTSPSIPTWYTSLIKPSYTPPGWVFTVVWLTLYTIMGISLYMIWVSEGNDNKRKMAIKFYFFHLALNSAWSLAFFGLKNLSFAFILITLLLVAIICLIKLFWNIERKAAYLLIPYLLWVVFAAFLNFNIWQLNQ